MAVVVEEGNSNNNNSSSMEPDRMVETQVLVVIEAVVVTSLIEITDVNTINSNRQLIMVILMSLLNVVVVRAPGVEVLADFITIRISIKIVIIKCRSIPLVVHLINTRTSIRISSRSSSPINTTQIEPEGGKKGPEEVVAIEVEEEVPMADENE